MSSDDINLESIELQLDSLETDFVEAANSLHAKWDDRLRVDSRLMNAMTKVGMSEDPGSHTEIKCAEKIPDTELEELYTSHDLCATVCDFYPERMVSEGIEIDAGKSKDSQFSGWADRKLKELNYTGRFLEALTWSNVYGSTVIIMDIDDGQNDYSKPVNLENIQSVRKLIVKDKTEIQPVLLLTDDVYNPTYYRFSMEETIGDSNELAQLKKSIKDAKKDLIHESRVLRFDAIKPPRRKAKQNGGWGYSILSRFRDAYFAYQHALQDLQGMVSKFEIPILKIQNLVGKLSKDKDAEGKIYARLKLLTTAIKNLGAIVCDKEHEDVEYLTRSLTGLAELLDRFAFRVVTAAGIPETQLFGRSSVGAGFSDAGLKERFFVAQKTKTLQQKHMREPMQKLLDYVLRSAENTFNVPDVWDFEFIDTMQLTPKELADLKESQANVDTMEVELGIVSPEEVRLSRHGGARWSAATILLSKKVKNPLPPPPMKTQKVSNVGTSDNEQSARNNSENKTDAIDTTVPQSVKLQIRRGLKLHKNNPKLDIDGQDLKLAKSLIADKKLSVNEIKKGYKFTVQNRKYARADKKSTEHAEWLLKGGSAGASWYRKMYKQLLTSNGTTIKTNRIDGELVGYYPEGETMKSHLDSI